MNLKTSFLDVELQNPIVIASSPLSENIDNIKKCCDYGAGAIIMKSCTSFNSVGKGYRRCCIDEKGFWASSTFDREIIKLKVSTEMIYETMKYSSIPIFASLTEPTLDPTPWIESSKILSENGISGIQLDFFYLEDIIIDHDFSVKFVTLLNTLKNEIDVPVFPKLNINLPTKFIVSLLKQANIKGVSILDSIRLPPPFDIFQMGKGKLKNVTKPFSSSLFGHWQYPLTLKYTHELVTQNISTCSGGGVISWENVVELLMLGASSVQICTDILINGFDRISTLKEEINSFLGSRGIENLSEIQGIALTSFGNVKERQFFKNIVHYDISSCTRCDKCLKQTFCNAIHESNGNILIDEVLCEGCSFCVNLCESNALFFK